MRRATITGWGKYVPPAVLSNSDLETLTDTTDEWIMTRTGIKERRITHVENSDMAVVAGWRALAAAGLDPTEIDILIVATCTPDRLIPSAASFVQPKLGVVNAGVMDINAACSGFVYGVTVANGLIASGGAGKILVIGSEKLSVLLDLDDRSTAVLFGDGAGAVVLEATDGPDGVLSANLGTDGSLAGILTASGFGTEDNVPAEAYRKLYMDGREVFRNAVTQMGASAAKALEDAGLDLDDVDLLIPHQANVRIIDATARRLNLPPEKVYVNIASYGNTSAASIPIALTEALEERRISPGDHVVFVAFGGGLTWAATAIRWGERVEPLGMSDAALPGTDMTGAELLLMRQEERRARRGY
jgi:3-oxoacyl-[acyl-carrier-protein] synthase-3